MRNIMVGLTHTEDGAPIVRAPRTLKVGIGIPKGRGIRAFIHPSGQWYVLKAEFDKGKLKENSHRFDTRAEAETFFHAEKDTAPVVGYPRKLAYFTFSRPVINKDGAEAYEPDFDAIEATGPVPTEIKVVFMSADPFEGAYQMWSATELKCRGDGVGAMRAVSMEPNNPAAIKAKEAGLRVFPVENGCWVKGCPYAGKDCKVGSSLNFQLARSVRVGGTAFFHTTGFRSTKDIFSSLEEIKTIMMMATGKSIIGIPMSLKLRPYITKPDGQKAATQYAVRVELDAVEISKLQSKLLSQSFQAQTLQIAGTVEAVETDEDDFPAGAMAAEFYPEADEAEEEPVTQATPAAAATQAKQDDIGAKLKAQREKAAAPVVETPAAATTAPVATAPAAAAAPVFPWPDQDKMMTMMRTERTRIGDNSFTAALEKNGLKSLNCLKSDDPKAVQVYEDMKAMTTYSAAGPAPAAAAGPVKGDLF